MSILDGILAKIGLTRAIVFKDISNVAGSSDPFAIWRSNKKVAVGNAMNIFSGWVYACIRAIAEEIMSMQFRLFQIKKDGTHEELFEHELLDLLDGANPRQSGAELKYLLSAHLEMVGNAFWWMEGVKNEQSKPIALYPLSPRYMKILKDEIGIKITGYKYTYKSTTRDFKPYEILHIKYPDPNDSLEGIGTVQTLAQWIDADNYATEFNRRFFLNGARLSGILSSESTLTEEQMKIMKSSFENLYKGVENAYQIGVLPKGVKYEDMGMAQKDMDFVNLLASMRDKILAGFRVPRTALGLTDDINRANAEATNYVFALRTIKPKMQMIVDYLNEFLVTRYGDNLYLSFVDPVPENRELKIQEMQAAVGNQPVISTNEAREEYFGLGGVENGESVMTSFSSVPLGAPVKSADRPKIKSRLPVRKIKIAKEKKEIATEIAKQAATETLKMQLSLEKFTKKDIENLSDDEFEMVWKTKVGRVTPYEKAVKEVLYSFNKILFKDVEKNLSEAIKSKAIDGDELFDQEGFIKKLSNLVEPIFIELWGKEGSEAMSLIGITMGPEEIITPQVRKAIKEAVKLLADSYNQTTRDLLVAKLEQGQAEGLGLSGLKDLVGEIEDFSDEVRAEQVARTETFRVANDATRDAWKESGVVKSLKWYTAADERVCEYCAPLNGKVVGIDKNFFDKGEIVAGTEGGVLVLDYDDITGGSLHPNCRCTIRPNEISIE